MSRADSTGEARELPDAIVGHVLPPSDDYTGSCPCGCGASFRDGKRLTGEELAWAVAEDREDRLCRIRAAAESDAELQGLPALRDFLLRETELYPDA